ncbi:glycosylated lysosomal membrane protein B-like isoform X2 [Vanessa cardui]|uniref:glycosylated lysosomal membrane protein B-like isoform X2 n=1 Tax=Vanessa cardui TaxID=171605 RepID=UPI001F1333B9|nr:glycosylated lysosomal membrane protein B-like isoform X2 [Vanessa cardui]
MNLQTILIFVGLSYAYGQDRKITAKLNPGCDICSSNTTLLYVKCDGASDTIHQIWDFTRHLPTVIFAVTSLNSTLNVTWTDKVPKSIALSEEPSYSFATAIDKLYEYDDLDDNGHIDPKFPQKAYKLDRVRWHLNESILSDKEAMIHVYGILNEERRGRPEIINIKLDLIPFKDYAADLPHLIHTANSTLVDVSLVNLTTSREYNASRYALHLLLVSTDPVIETMHYTMRKSLDDEHTPGVFEDRSPASQHAEAVLHGHRSGLPARSGHVRIVRRDGRRVLQATQLHVVVIHHRLRGSTSGGFLLLRHHDNIHRTWGAGCPSALRNHVRAFKAVQTQ